MPGCAVYGCGNYSRKTKNSDIKYHRFPSDEELAKRWLSACQRQDNVNLKNACICSVHFHENCYEVPLKYRLLNYLPSNARILKNDAVPSLNLPIRRNDCTQEYFESKRTARGKQQKIETPLVRTRMEKYCRTCLRMERPLFPLFEDKSLCLKIKTISNIEMLPGDNLPKGICEDCVQNVDFVFNFRTLLINNERDLATRLPHLSCDDSGSEQDVLEKKFIPSKDEACFLEEVENSVPEEVDEVEDIIPERDKVSAEQTVPTKQIVSKSDMFKNCIIQCKRCNFTCMDYDEWLKHRVTHRVSYSMCDFCGKTVRTCNLKKHLVVHDGDPATCNICGKVFKNVESLRGHAPVHRGYRYNCDLCGSKFKFQHHFAKHRRTHFESERKIECTVCSKRFFDSQTFKKHQRVHTGERPYPCDRCDKKLSSSYALKTHMRQHTKEKPFVCEICPMAFAQKCSLKSHIKSKHPDCYENEHKSEGAC